MAKARMKSIARIDQERRYKTTKGKWATKNTRGWYVQVAWNRRKYTRFFSDGTLGGKNKARLAAIEWRDATEKKIGKPQVAGQVVYRSGNRPNVGVSLTVKEGAPVYQVSWVDRRGKPGRTTVSIRKWGRAQAKKKALSLRKKLHAQTSGR